MRRRGVWGAGQLGAAAAAHAGSPPATPAACCHTCVELGRSRCHDACPAGDERIGRTCRVRGKEQAGLRRRQRAAAAAAEHPAGCGCIPRRSARRKSLERRQRTPQKAHKDGGDEHRPQGLPAGPPGAAAAWVGDAGICAIGAGGGARSLPGRHGRSAGWHGQGLALQPTPDWPANPIGTAPRPASSPPPLPAPAQQQFGWRAPAAPGAPRMPRSCCAATLGLPGRAPAAQPPPARCRPPRPAPPACRRCRPHTERRCVRAGAGIGLRSSGRGPTLRPPACRWSSGTGVAAARWRTRRTKTASTRRSCA